MEIYWGISLHLELNDAAMIAGLDKRDAMVHRQVIFSKWNEYDCNMIGYPCGIN